MFSDTFKSSVLVFIILSVAGFAVYANSLDVPFYLDDFRNITENSHVRINTVSFSTLCDAAFKSPLATRPVANVSFALNYFLHQENVFGYHLVNIVMHVCTGFFLYLLFSVTLSTPALLSRYRDVRLVSFFAALLWLVHPLHTGSVVYIVQRMVIMAVMWYVLSLLCYAKGRMAPAGARRWGWLSGSFFCAVLAMGAKEIAVTLPFVIFLYEYYFFQDLDWKWLRGKLWLAGIFLLFGAIVVTLYGGSLDALSAVYEKRPFTMLERVYTEFRVVLLYLSLILYPDPSRLNLDHYITVSHSLFDPVATVLSVGAIILALIAAVFSAKKQRLLSFAIFWYLGNLVLESSLLGLELIFEHRTYLPSIFVIFVGTVLLNELIRSRRLAIALFAVVIVVCSYWTVKRNEMWRDPVLFWTDSVAKSPRKARPYMNLSVALRERGEIDKAVIASRKAISIDPRFVNGYVGLGAAYAEKEDLVGAEAQYLKALQMMPEYAKVYNALGVIYLKQGKVKKALAAFDENLRLDPNNVNALVNRASTLASQGYFSAAIADFHQALEAGGRNPDILFNLAVTYVRKGDTANAIQAFEEVLRYNPRDRDALVYLEQLRSRLHQ